MSHHTAPAPNTLRRIVAVLLGALLAVGVVASLATAALSTPVAG